MKLHEFLEKLETAGGSAAKFLRNCEEVGVDAGKYIESDTRPFSVLNRVFVWRDAPEGHDYWNDINEALLTIEQQESEEEMSTTTTMDTPFQVGKQYLVRTVTHYMVGRVTRVVGNFVEMEDASWIADTGRFNECWTNPDSFKEVEPITSKQYGFAMGAVIDYGRWEHSLPKSVK